MKIFIAVTLLAAVAAAQQFNAPLTWMSPDLLKYQGPYAGQYYGNSYAPLPYMTQPSEQVTLRESYMSSPMEQIPVRESYMSAPTEQIPVRESYMSAPTEQIPVRASYLQPREIPALNPLSGILTLDEIVKLPLFHQYLNIPLFKQFFPTQEFQHYLISPMFQQHWTSPMFQQLFMDASLFYKHIFPMFHQYNTGSSYFKPARDMSPPSPYYQTVPSFNTETVATPFSYDLVDQPKMKKPTHPFMVYLIKKQATKVPATLTITETPPPALVTDESESEMRDRILAEKIVKTVLSQYNQEGPAKKQDPNFRAEDVKLTYDSLSPEEAPTGLSEYNHEGPAKKQDPNFRAEDVKLTYDSLSPEEQEQAKTQDPNFHAEDVKLTYDSIIPQEPETVEKVPAVDVNLVSLTTEDPTMSQVEEMKADSVKEEKVKEILNAMKAKRFTRLEVPQKPTELNLIGAEEANINNLRYDVVPEESHDRIVRESRPDEYKTIGNNGFNVVPLPSNADTYSKYAGATGQETPVEKPGSDDDSYNLA